MENSQVDKSQTLTTPVKEKFFHLGTFFKKGAWKVMDTRDTTNCFISNISPLPTKENNTTQIRSRNDRVKEQINLPSALKTRKSLLKNSRLFSGTT